MKKIQITIPKPCHEDWSKMSSVEKGRFCDKCAKKVHDFSNTTDTVIQEYISEHKDERICGRFRNDQLTYETADNINRPNRKHFSYSQVFILSLLIVFGTSLFSCTNFRGDTVGIIVSNDTVETIVADSTETDSLVSDSLVPMMTGMTEVSFAVGDVYIDADSTDSSLIDVITDTVDLHEVNIDGQSIKYIGITQGALVYTAQINEQPDSIEVDSVSGTVSTHLENVQNEISLVYPNPVHETAHLKFYISNEKNIEVGLFDMNGKLIRVLLNKQRMQAGERVVEFNVSDLVPATYIVRLVKGDETESTRIIVL